MVIELTFIKSKQAGDILAESKKQIPLRLSAKLYAELSAWAEDDFRSVNGQIEYLLTECVKYRKKKSSKNTAENNDK